jgi:hypothetical protein
MKEWTKVLKAADAAARWHVHQRRKGAAQEPYINHLLEVATLVAEATGGTDQDLVIAALLHDAIEDCEVPRELIAKSFGTEVAELVAEVTDDKTLAKEHRKNMQAETAHKKSPKAKVRLLIKPAICAHLRQAQPRTGLCGGSLNTLGGRAHVFPCPHLRGVNRDREKEFAVARDNLGQFSGRSERPSVRRGHGRKLCQDLVFKRCHAGASAGLAA